MKKNKYIVSILIQETVEAGDPAEAMKKIETMHDKVGNLPIKHINAFEITKPDFKFYPSYEQK